MTKPPELQTAVKEALWRRGDLRWKLDTTQREMYDVTVNGDHDFIVWNCSRRLGKSFALGVISFEICLKKTNQTVYYVATTGDQVRQFLMPMMEQIAEDAPKDCTPRFSTQSGDIIFPNGSRVRLKGCEDEKKANRLRGNAAALIIVDEAGFIPVLSYALQVLNPLTMTTGGKTILASTPPVSMGHEFIDYLNAAKDKGAYVHKTLYQNARITPAMVQRHLEKDAMRFGISVEEFTRTSTFKREYLAEPCQDENRSVVPEWQQHGAKCIAMDVGKIPPYAQLYQSLDLGHKDGSGCVFAYWDISRQKLCVIDEVLLRSGTTAQLADQIRETEKRVFEGMRVQRRVADGAGLGLQIIMDLNSEHGLAFSPTKKDDKRLQVDKLRRMVALEQIIIHPRCQKLIAQIRDTVWKLNNSSAGKGKDTYERNKWGHGDLLDALVYLVRNVDFRAQAPKSLLGFNDVDGWNVEKPLSHNAKELKKLFQPKKWFSRNT